ncbi:hypothetical protein ACFY9A_19255 [Streptomyces rubradiris]|uniref:hypothetical protein n=1 Tax=Streptomyces rubradiris TaxID=285531 RepID=UPI0036E00454
MPGTANNAKEAVAKSRCPRVAPVTQDLAGLYADYQPTRDDIPEAAGCDMVFLNLFHASPSRSPACSGVPGSRRTWSSPTRAAHCCASRTAASRSMAVAASGATAHYRRFGDMPRTVGVP